MDANQYQQAALVTAIQEFNPIPVEFNPLLLAALGAAGETGEFADRVKKIIFHRENPQEALKEELPTLKMELGDALWYINFAANALGLTLSEV